MAKNTLFNFIKYFIYQNQNNLPLNNQTRAYLRQDSKNREYFFFDLPYPGQNPYTMGPINLSLADEPVSLELIEHHVTVYDNQTAGDPFFSQSHYTADLKVVFKDEKKEMRCRLHVYFNNEGIVITDPVLNILHNEQENNKKVTVKNQQQDQLLDQDQLDTAFIKLASAGCNLITELNKRKTEKIDELTCRYEKDDASSMEENLSENDRNVIIQRMIDTCALLTLLFKHVKLNEYAKRQSFLRSILNAPKSTKTPSQTAAKSTPSAPTPKPTQPSRKIQQKQKHVKAKGVDSHKKGQQQSKQTPEDLISRYNEIKKILDQNLNDENLDNENLNKERLQEFKPAIKDLGNLYAELHEIFLTDFDNVPLSDELRKNLHQLHIQLRQDGIKCLLQLVNSKNYDLAAILTNFYFALDEDLFVKALETGDADRLDFLLEHGEYTLNEPILIGKKHYNSAVHYCISICNERAMERCFATLVKHEASLLGNDDDGLPCAYTILHPEHKLENSEHQLQTPAEHKFYSLIKEDKELIELTLDSKSFNQQLSNLLKYYLNNNKNKLNEQRKTELSNAIAMYYHYAHSLILAKRGLQGQIGRILRNADEDDGALTPSIRAKLHSNPLHEKQSKAMDKKAMKYLASLSPTQRGQCMRLAQELVTSEQLSLKREDLSNCDYDKIVAADTKETNDTIQLMQIIQERAQIQKNENNQYNFRPSGRRAKKDMRKANKAFDKQVQDMVGENIPLHRKDTADKLLKAIANNQQKVLEDAKKTDIKNKIEKQLLPANYQPSLFKSTPEDTSGPATNIFSNNLGTPQ